jgi:outer membrane protein OmpA-like peptidoglycan-associated protein
MEGGDQVKSNPDMLKQAAAISAAVYKEYDADASYWEKYYKGTQERDKQGLTVDLGGSKVNNVADNLLLFGLVQGSTNLFAATYKIFGDIVVAQYPKLVPNYPPVKDILDTSYVQAVAKKMAPATIAQAVKKETPKFQPSATPRMVSSKSWHINFETGKAAFTPAARQQLEKLLRDLVITNTMVEIHGHTDSVGNPTSNMALSESRAFAVKQWLERQSSVNFPQGRIRVFSHGQTNPIASNATPQGRAQNRRVDIILKATAASGAS